MTDETTAREPLEALARVVTRHLPAIGSGDGDFLMLRPDIERARRIVADTVAEGWRPPVADEAAECRGLAFEREDCAGFAECSCQTVPAPVADDVREVLAQHWSCDYVGVDVEGVTWRAAYECGITVPHSSSLTEMSQHHIAAALATEVQR